MLQQTKLHTKILLLTILVIIMATVVYYIFSVKRYAVFAGYNPNGIIAPYVITYLKGLNEVTDGIVYITDSNLKETEKAKLKDINIIYQQHTRHNEYDWGSYKRGYLWLKENNYLKHTDELILANDSCIAPITSFKPMFYTMRFKPYLDFWGDLKNDKYIPHLQSYFLVFRPQVFNSATFTDFLSSVTNQPTRNDYIKKYELRLTQTLQNKGFKWDCYIPYHKLSNLPILDKNTHPIKLIKEYNRQFIKKRTFTGGIIVIEQIPYILSYLQQHHPLTYEDIKTILPPRLMYLVNTSKDYNK